MVASEISHPDHSKTGQARIVVDIFHEMHTRWTLIRPTGGAKSFPRGTHPASHSSSYTDAAVWTNFRGRPGQLSFALIRVLYEDIDDHRVHARVWGHYWLLRLAVYILRRS
jgi:hypothetical protein